MLYDLVKNGNAQALFDLLLTDPPPLSVGEISDSLYTAAFEGYSEILRFLLTFFQDRIDIAAKTIALNCAIESMHLDMVKLLLDHGADVNLPDQYNTTPLAHSMDIEAEESHRRYDSGDHSAVPTSAITEMLIKYGADINAKAFDNSTPLKIAFLLGHRPAQKLLLELGATL